MPHKKSKKRAEQKVEKQPEPELPLSQMEAGLYHEKKLEELGNMVEEMGLTVEDACKDVKTSLSDLFQAYSSAYSMDAFVEQHGQALRKVSTSGRVMTNLVMKQKNALEKARRECLKYDPAYPGNEQDLDKLIEFIEGDSEKTKKGKKTAKKEKK